jgi:4-amino-4-deoxy-L-arabinose transferase-like glycosyltransferase
MMNSRRIFFLLVIAVFLWSVALRAVEVVNKNYLFGFDHGRDYLAAYNIAVNHKLTLIGAEVGAGAAGLSNIFHGPGYYYLIAFMYVLFRGDPYGGLLLMFLFGVMALFAVFITTRRMFGRAVSLVTLLLLGISPLIVTQSRFMWNHHPSTFFIVIALYFAYMITKKPRIYAPLALLTAGLIYHFELAIAVPFVIALSLSLPLVFRIKDVLTYVYCIIAGALAFSPFLLFESRHGWMAVRSIFIYATPHGPVGKDVWYLRIMDHMGPYIANAANSFATEHGILPYKLFTLLSFVLFIVLCVFAWKVKDKTHRIFFRFLLLLLIVSYGVLLFLDNIVWDYYLIHAHVIYISVFAYSLITSYRAMHKSMWAKAAFTVLTVFLLSMTASSAWRMMISYKYDLHDFGGVEKIKGKKSAIDYVYRDAKGKPFSEFTFMAPIYTYPYDYLFQTYGKEKYGYVPAAQKKGLVYLIIEPDASKPWTYKGWLETVIVGGDIISTTTIPSGQIVQKRMFPL